MPLLPKPILGIAGPVAPRVAGHPAKNAANIGFYISKLCTAGKSMFIAPPPFNGGPVAYAKYNQRMPVLRAQPIARTGSPGWSWLWTGSATATTAPRAGRRRADTVG